MTDRVIHVCDGPSPRGSGHRSALRRRKRGLEMVP